MQAHRLQLLAPFHFDALFYFYSFSFCATDWSCCYFLLPFANSKNITIYASSPAKKKWKRIEWREARLLPSFCFFHILPFAMRRWFLFPIPCALVWVFMLYAPWKLPLNVEVCKPAKESGRRRGEERGEWESWSGEREATRPHKFDRKSLLLPVLCCCFCCPTTESDGMLQILSYLFYLERKPKFLNTLLWRMSYVHNFIIITIGI